jgi:acetyl esterase/lipase
MDKEPPFDRNPDTCLALRAFDGYFETVPTDDVRASPYLDSLSGLPPILIHESTGDVPGILAGARALRDKLIAAGNACSYREWDTVPHIWPTFGMAFAYSLEAATEAGAWIKERLD